MRGEKRSEAGRRENKYKASAELATASKTNMIANLVELLQKTV